MFFFQRKFYASENAVVSLLAIGEGYHNYHHTFPWDYKAAELEFDLLNCSKLFIDFFAWIGWAYDLKSVPERVIKERAKRTGDGSYEKVRGHSSDHSVTNKNYSQSQTEGNVHGSSVSNLPVWGWGDTNIPEEHLNVTQRLFMLGFDEK